MSHVELQPNLDAVAQRHAVEGIVVSDSDGLLIANSTGLSDAVPLAATTPFVNEGTRIGASTPTPTATRRIPIGDTHVLVGVVGEPGRCRAALQEATRWIQSVLAA